MGLGKWAEAADYYGRAARLAPSFSFASANRTLALYQLGQTSEAVREMRCACCCWAAEFCHEIAVAGNGCCHSGLQLAIPMTARGTL